jgi:uncharacterized protein
MEAAQSEAERGRTPAETDYVLVSLGTGSLKKAYAHEQTRNWGPIEWSRPILDIVFDGIGDTVDYQLRVMFEAQGGLGRYYRFQGDLDQATNDLDDASKPCMQRLRDLACRIYERNKSSYAQLVQDLASPRDEAVQTGLWAGIKARVAQMGDSRRYIRESRV